MQITRKNYDNVQIVLKLCHDPCDAIKMREMRGEVEKKTHKKNNQYLCYQERKESIQLC